MDAVIDRTYIDVDFLKGEIEHCYGDQVHILADPVSLGQLADLCSAETIQPGFNNLIRELYQFLIRNVVMKEFPTETVNVSTRMAAVSKYGVWSGRVINKKTKTITVNIIRAGALPSQIAFDFFCRILDPHFVRQDHVIMGRTVDAEERVVGAQMSGSKIGGDILDSMLLFPDPMGATGSSTSEIVSYYKNNVLGKPKKIFAVHLMVTPEYLRRMKKDHPDVLIYALRLDRAASPPHVLKSKPGTFFEEESGLTERHYIVPGGGGFGELINNSYC